MQTENDTTKPETELKQETGEGCPGATCSASSVQWTESTPDREGYYWRTNPMGCTKIVLVTEELDAMTTYGGFQPVSEYPEGGLWAGPIPLPNDKGVAPLPAGADSDHKVEVITTHDVENRGAGSGCPPPSCSHSSVSAGERVMSHRSGVPSSYPPSAAGMLDWSTRPSMKEQDRKSSGHDL